MPFISEVVEQLENESIQYLSSEYLSEITKDNVFKDISNHEKNGKLYSKRLHSEIEFISSYFYELCEENEDELGLLSVDMLMSILSDSMLKLRDEDQLLNFMNRLYVNDKKFNVLYETVYFSNASSNSMSEFVNVYDINDVTGKAWNMISTLLIQETSFEVIDEERYKEGRVKKGIEFK